jgi:hypothetical protein
VQQSAGGAGIEIGTPPRSGNFQVNRTDSPIPIEFYLTSNSLEIAYRMETNLASNEVFGNWPALTTND